MSCNNCKNVEKCQDYIDQRGKVEIAYNQTLQVAELDIVNYCNLSCYSCNRFMDVMPTKNRMTLEQIKNLVKESIDINWKWKELRIMGGEPTIHPEFEEICHEVLKLKEHDPSVTLKVITNGSGKKVKERIKLIPDGYIVANSETRYEETGVALTKEDSEYAVRPNARMIPSFGNMWQAPIDNLPIKKIVNFAGKINPTRQVDMFKEKTIYTCQVHETCGLGISHLGILPCGCGNAIGRVLGLDFFFQSLKEITVEACEEKLKLLCAFCGRNMNYTKNIEEDKSMSSFWQAAFEDYHTNGEKSLPIIYGDNNECK